MPKLIQRSEYRTLRYPLQEFVKRLNQVPELAEEVMQTAHARVMVLQSMILNDHDTSTIPEDQEIKESVVSEMRQIDQELQLVCISTRLIINPPPKPKYVLSTYSETNLIIKLEGSLR